MDLNDPQSPVTLPEELRRQFAEVEKRLWRVETAAAVCWLLTGLMASFLAQFLSDRLGDTPSSVRWTWLIAGLAMAVWAASRWISRWVLHRRDFRDLARLVQQKYRRLGDRLLGIVELAN